eukprot:10050784-Lingulodinium_polyedra.AAC.1
MLSMCLERQRKVWSLTGRRLKQPSGEATVPRAGVVIVGTCLYVLKGYLTCGCAFASVVVRHVFMRGVAGTWSQQ